MLSIEEAFKRIIGSVKPLTTEQVAVEKASGRVLAAPLPARRSQPSAPLSAMDGYAVQAEDLEGADKTGASLKLIGESAAGKPFDGTLAKGAAVRIFTGAVVPEGANQVVMQENATLEGDSVTFKQAAKMGDNIRPQGADFSEGEHVLGAGTYLSPKSIGLAAAAGFGTVMVYRRPKVALLATGDELVAPDAKSFKSGETVDSVRPLLASLFADAGADVYFNRHVTDDMAAIKLALSQCADADVLVTIGGASVGERDYMRDAFKESGVTLDFWKMAMRPGKPLIYGKRGAQQVLGLPGNPVSAFVCALLLVRPLIDAMMGRPAPMPTGVMLPSAVDLPANGPRAHYMRAQLVGVPGERRVDPAVDQDSSLLSVLAQCDGLLVRPIDGGPVKAGEPVAFVPF